jgi:acetolactate synthase small subunit
MNSDDRLDQLEPLLAQNLATADRHTGQLRQIIVQVQQLTTLAVQQSDNSEFALRELVDVKNTLAEVKAGQAAQGETLARILDLLQGGRP